MLMRGCMLLQKKINAIFFQTCLFFSVHPISIQKYWLFISVGKFIIPIDELIFFRRARFQPPTRSRSVRIHKDQQRSMKIHRISNFFIPSLEIPWKFRCPTGTTRHDHTGPLASAGKSVKLLCSSLVEAGMITRYMIWLVVTGT